MSNFDRFQPLSYEEERKQEAPPKCDCCGEDVYIGDCSGIYLKDTDVYYCDASCLMSSFNETEIVEALGGEWV